MMGYGPPPNDPLFSYNVQLETRVRKDHPLRKIKELVDFEFIYEEVEKTYGANGNVSIPPPVLLDLFLITDGGRGPGAGPGPGRIPLAATSGVVL